MDMSLDEMRLRNWFALNLHSIDTSDPYARRLVEEALRVLGVSPDKQTAFFEGRLDLPYYGEAYAGPIVPRMSVKLRKVRREEG